MSRFAPLAVLVTLAFSLTACAGMQAGGRSDRIDGRVLANVDGERVPVGEVAVTITPLGGETHFHRFTIQVDIAARN